MDSTEIETLILEAIPGVSLVRLEDPRGDGAHYNLTVASSSFAGRTRVDQHRMVHAAIRKKIGEKIHAFSIQTIVDSAQDIPIMQSARFERIEKEIMGNDVVLYMRGTAAFPRCNFSAYIVQVLSQLGIRFCDVNAMDDTEFRQSLSDFANWPTLPQLYVKGEFIGGADIVREMYETGELQEFLKDRGIL